MAKDQGQRESFIHVHVDGAADAAERADVVRALGDILADVRLSVQDWGAMLARVRDVIADLRANPPPLPAAEIAEAVQFLEWLAGDNFTMLGARDYAFTSNGTVLEPDFATGLGLLRSRDMRPLQRWNQPLTITPEIGAFLELPRLLLVTKSTIRSRIHRRADLDYIGIKRFDRDGKLLGEHRFCGLFTSTAYTRSVRAIPYLRRKADDIIRRAGFEPNSHSGKALVNVLETYPRDELFQIEDDQLYDFALAILQLGERPRVRVLPRYDRFDRFVSVLVYVPRDRYDSRIRALIGDYLAATYKGVVRAFYPFFPEGPLVRVQFVIGHGEGEMPHPDRAMLDEAVEAIVRSWTDGLAQALGAAYDPGKARSLLARYRDAFPIDYREVYLAAIAVGDIRVARSADAGASARRRFLPTGWRGLGARGAEGISAAAGRFRSPSASRCWKTWASASLTSAPTTSRRKTLTEAWFHDMELESASGEPVDLAVLEQRLEACFLVVMGKKAESDGYNALVLATGLGWRDVALIRTISRFLRQIRVPYSQDYMAATLRKHAAIAAQIVALFRARFDPHLKIADEARAASEAEIAAAIDSALQAVESLDEDRIIRHFVNAVQSAIRTNYFQLDRDGQTKELIAIKFASRKVDDMPLPRPLYEIFVYSPRVEAAHLRFGKVARGGIRWSDRPQDFRTEILGLVKAQNVKNAVIVPVGAKGGFVPEYLPAVGSREAIQAEGVATYKMFISTLLDITDNIGPGTAGVIPPADVVRKEGDDPYLVVAADKGTATFSDIANDIAIAHDYWLGDAFASGGSAGYDHKKIGITARGAWESVTRHFREMDIDVADHAVHRGRRRRHVGRRVRQRHAARENDQADRRLRPPRYLHRSRPRSGTQLRRAAAPVRSAALELAGFRQGADFQGRWRLSALGQGNPSFRRGAKAVRRHRATAPQDLIRAILKAPVDLLFFRRHRHLCPRRRRNRRRRRRPRQRRHTRHRQGLALHGDRRGCQSRHDPARPRRGGVGRYQAQYRCDRQFCRREYFGHGGQSQDRAERSTARRPVGYERPQRAARRND